jgi:hypothetical protein
LCFTSVCHTFKLNKNFQINLIIRSLYFVNMTAQSWLLCLPWSFIFSINCLMLGIENLTKILSLMCCLLWQHIELTSLMCCHGIFKHAVRFYHYWRGHNQLFRISMQIYKPQRDSSLIVGLPFWKGDVIRSSGSVRIFKNNQSETKNLTSCVVTLLKCQSWNLQTCCKFDHYWRCRV